jgi:hypothetical protein
MDFPESYPWCRISCVASCHIQNGREREKTMEIRKTGNASTQIQKYTLLATQIKTDLNINKVKEVARRFLQQDFFLAKNIIFPILKSATTL